MNKLKAMLCATVLLSLSACKKDGNSTTLTITVIDGRTGNIAVGAAVTLYTSAAEANGTDAPKYSKTTDQNGKVKLTVAYLSQYFVLAGTNNEKNYYSGFIPGGIFTSQADIRSSPGQTPAAVVGGIKFKDINGDGIINVVDKVSAPSVSLKANTNNTFSTIIY